MMKDRDIPSISQSRISLQPWWSNGELWRYNQQYRSVQLHWSESLKISFQSLVYWISLEMLLRRLFFY